MKRHGFAHPAGIVAAHRFKVLYAALILSAVCLIAAAVWLKNQPASGIADSVFVAAAQPLAVPAAPEKKSVAYYDAILQRSGLFMAQMGIPVADIPEPTPVIDDGLSIKDLQLQGIVSGRRGLQAIIGLAASEQTYYCQGGELVGGYTIKAVEKDKVIMEKSGKIFELRVR